MAFGVLKGPGDDSEKKKVPPAVIERALGAQNKIVSAGADKAQATVIEATPNTLAGFIAVERAFEERLQGEISAYTRTPNKGFEDGGLHIKGLIEKLEKVRKFSLVVKNAWDTGDIGYAKYSFRLFRDYIKLGEAGVEAFIERDLKVLIKRIIGRKVHNFEHGFKLATDGDRLIALLATLVADLERQEKSNPKLGRVVLNLNGKSEQSIIQEEDPAAMLVAGYGAGPELYEQIFDKANMPVAVVTLPHTVINPDPEVVKKAFNESYDRILKDNLINNVTKIIGNSTGTMLALRLAIDLCNADPTRTIDLALIQTGANWVDAVERATGLYAQQFREIMQLQGKGDTWKGEFAKATEGFNPEEMVADIAKFTSEGRLKLSIFQGMGDRNIRPAKECINPFLNKLNAAGVDYDAHLSNEAGHSSAVLYFFWLAFVKDVKEWGSMFSFDAEKGRSVRAPSQEMRAPASGLKTVSPPSSSSA